MSSIVVNNLKRHFGPLKAVDGLSFEIDAGSVCGFVGANGAGKTSTMRIMATLDYATSGTVEICGHNVLNAPQKVRSLLGWMPDDFGNYDNMTVLEYLDFYARTLGYHGKERQMRVQEVMEFADLLPLADRMSNKLSKGMTQRLCLGRSLIHDPEVLIMDEPAAGLDPKARVELKNLIRLLSEEGKTIFISSHILSELGEMCDTLLFINGGKIVHHGDSDSLKHSSDISGGSIYDIKVIGDPSKVASWVLTAPNTQLIEERKEGGRIRIDSSTPEVAARVLQGMIKDGLMITEFHKEQRNLEDAFIDILGQLESGNTQVTTPPPLPSVLASSAKN
ncbi:ABC transporter ATP-binding protein [Rubritalea sp.]|uniref:ABC transporter ATP-binding protein n=1 Tax=Rubritalea sp. TaxID=2109375 RepID=UPI003EF52B41